MEKKQVGFAAVSVMHGSQQGTGYAANGIVVSVAVHEKVFGAAMSDHLMTAIAGNLFATIIPEDDTPLTVNQIYGRRKVFQDRAVSLRR
jgi:hypothetical protein